MKVPLNQKQVKAANDLHDTVDLWQSTDRMWPKLKEVMPGWSIEESIVKCTLVDRLYSTNVFAIERMAQHVKDIFEMRSKIDDDQLVEHIAQRKAPESKKPRREISFASKLCHLFVSDRFPIYDSAARETLEMHLGHYVDDKASPYKAFRENLRMLCKPAGITDEGRSLDRYLWIVGLYMRWLQKPKISAELRRIFENPSAEQAICLDALLPLHLERPFLTRSKRKAG